MKLSSYLIPIASSGSVAGLMTRVLPGGDEHAFPRTTSAIRLNSFNQQTKE